LIAGAGELLTQEGGEPVGFARPDSDVDRWIVADDAGRRLEAAARVRRAIEDVWVRPFLTLMPMAPHYLAEKPPAEIVGEPLLEIRKRVWCPNFGIRAQCAGGRSVSQATGIQKTIQFSKITYCIEARALL